MSSFFDWREGSDLSPSQSMNDFGNSLFNGLDMQSYWSATSDRFDDDLVILPPFEVTASRDDSDSSYDFGSPVDLYRDMGDLYPGDEHGGGGGDSGDSGNSTDTVPDEAGESLLEPGETTRRTININGREREYLVHVPKNYQPGESTPLVLVYHGVNSDAATMQDVTQFSQKADQNNFIVVFMDGNDENRLHSWNNGQLAFSRDTDDIAFTRGVLDQVQSDLNVDRSEVFAVGFSQGESLVHRLANDPSMSGTFAAIGVVGGWMTGQENPQANGDLSVINIKSNDDPTVPAQGRFNWWFANMRPDSADETYYRNLDGITTPPDRQAVYDAQGNLLRVESTSVNEDTGNRVTSVRLEDEGHVWPGGPGTVHEENNATNMILDFFGLEPGATYLNNEDVTYAPYYGDSLDRAVKPGIIRHGRPAGSRP